VPACHLAPDRASPQEAEPTLILAPMPAPLLPQSHLFMILGATGLLVQTLVLPALLG
jgi:hypothetical protein